MSLFSGAASTAGYAERTARLVPGLADMHKMTGLLLAERAPSDGTILVLGAGGGVELKAFARMQPDFVSVHHSFPTDPAGKDRWLARYAAFSTLSGTSRSLTENGMAAMKERLPVLTPEQDADLLRQAGFVDVETFYTAFTFRGWVATAG